MAQTQNAPVDRGEQLVTRWRGELDAMLAAGDRDGLQRQQTAYALSAAQLLAGGKVEAALRFAGLAQHATTLLTEAVRVRELRRPLHVTEELIGRDL